jgi:hypothetical protein
MLFDITQKGKKKCTRPPRAKNKDFSRFPYIKIMAWLAHTQNSKGGNYRRAERDNDAPVSRPVDRIAEVHVDGLVRILNYFLSSLPFWRTPRCQTDRKRKCV